MSDVTDIAVEKIMRLRAIHLDRAFQRSLSWWEKFFLKWKLGFLIQWFSGYEVISDGLNTTLKKKGKTIYVSHEIIL